MKFLSTCAENEKTKKKIPRNTRIFPSSTLFVKVAQVLVLSRTQQKRIEKKTTDFSNQFFSDRNARELNFEGRKTNLPQISFFASSEEGLGKSVVFVSVRSTMACNSKLKRHAPLCAHGVRKTCLKIGRSPRGVSIPAGFRPFLSGNVKNEMTCQEKMKWLVFR